MGTEPVGVGVGPEADPRAEYDYVSGAVARPELRADLEGLVAGDVRFDAYTRALYATDASAYEVPPIGVVFPVSTADVVAVVGYCGRRGIPVLPRGGGTSLAGQAVNEAVVLDFTRYMDGILEVDPEGRRLRAQPGVYLGTINEALAADGLKFAPDPAWADKSALGGAIGNNSTGSHSLVYGKTDAYVEEVEVVLADGSVAVFGEVAVEDLAGRGERSGIEGRVYREVVRILKEDAAEIRARFPALKRNVSGYNLGRLVEEADEGVVNLARLFAGSEGTLGIVTAAEVSLEPVPGAKAVALLTYSGLVEAMLDVAPVLEHGPAAVEVMDDVLLGLARETAEFGELVELLPAGTGSVLLVEFYADDPEGARRKVEGLVGDRVREADGTDSGSGDAQGVRTDAPSRAVEGLEAYEPADQAAFWKLRKSGLPILLSRTTDEKHISFIEDCAVPPERLPEYVVAFREILEEHGTSASFYAHAGPGVLHVRPLINTKTVAGVEQMESIADAVTDLVVEYGGAVSGEHGDGRARTQWTRKMYGERVWETFRGLKDAFDPDWVLNPGQVCGEVSMTEHLRFDPSYEFRTGFTPVLEWRNANGFRGMAELCHGCGGCRGPQSTTGGVMCPTYRASQEEITSTRGRANMLRLAMSGELPRGEAVSAEFLREVMDLCIGCKGCARDCPSEVDMAKLKAEVTHAYHREHGVTVRERVFRDLERVMGWGSRLAPVSNWAGRVPGADWLAEWVLGIARERPLPQFSRESFEDWFEARGPRVSVDDAVRRAVVVPDPEMNYLAPEIGRAAVRALEAAGVRVRLAPGVRDSGRAAYSTGFLDVARERARANVEALASRIEDGWDVVVVEPSDAVMFQSDLADLLPLDASVEAVMANTYGVCEYLITHDLLTEVSAEPDPGAGRVTYHGHCHQKATKREGFGPAALRAVGYEVDVLDSGCCGMAGSFGYEKEHYAMSLAIGRILFDQVDASGGDIVAAPGASCRTQLREHTPSPVHPIELVDDAL